MDNITLVRHLQASADKARLHASGLVAELTQTVISTLTEFDAEISGKLQAPEKSSAGYLIASDGKGGTTLMGIASEATEGDTKPISGGAVYRILGDIEAILATI